MVRFKTYLDNAKERYSLSEAFRKQAHMILITGIMFLAGVSLFISDIGVQMSALGLIAGFYALISIISILLLIFAPRRWVVVSSVMSVSTLLLFSFLLYHGGAGGFFAAWILLFPFINLLLWESKKGVWFSLLMLADAVVCLWTPCRELMPFKYPNVFIIWFPLVYSCCLIIACALGNNLSAAWEKLRGASEKLNRLYKMDEYTESENRRFLILRLNELWNLMLRAKGSFSILMIDLDYFKLYNDHYGQLSGDHALAKVARAVTGIVSRKNDVVCRWGGEEFVVLLPATDLAGAKKLAADIMEAVKQLNIPHEGTKLPEKRVTISIGVASKVPDTSSTPLKLLELADKSLHSAKWSGRNCICAD